MAGSTVEPTGFPLVHGWAATCPACGEGDWAERFRYTAPPLRETRYAVLAEWSYQRSVRQCRNCGHFVSEPRLDPSRLYLGDYVQATYGGLEGLHAAYRRITTLPPERSDNLGRVRWLNAALAANGVTPSGGPLLDVGSGLGVFPAAMQAAGWKTTALDPDPLACRHLTEILSLRTICADFFSHELSPTYALVTLNKVIEHVVDPVAMLQKAAQGVRRNGFIYIEVPDGEVAAVHGAEREEFTIDHLHIFSAASLLLMAQRAGLRLRECQRLQEPSTKFTLRGIFTR